MEILHGLDGRKFKKNFHLVNKIQFTLNFLHLYYIDKCEELTLSSYVVYKDFSSKNSCAIASVSTRLDNFSSIIMSANNKI